MPTIGVTGHRALRETAKLEAGVDNALRRIADEFPGGPWMIVSSLAEGADRLVARRGLARKGTRLIVPLPLPRDEYINDFESDESKREFLELLERAHKVIMLPPQPSRGEAYRAAGLYILDRCHVLLAVWDGKEAQSAGSTAQIVAEARRRKLPIAWVHAGNRKPGTDAPTSLGAEQGMVTFENFPAE